jgi:hypothetical protein
MSSKTLEQDLRVEEYRIDEGSNKGQEVEEYDCGCKVRFRRLDYGEARDELPKKSVLVPEFLPCIRHVIEQSVPPHARLVKVRHEYESFLNE